MNDGLNPDVFTPENTANPHEFSQRWWRQIAAMINEGFDRFCAKRKKDFKPKSFRQQIQAQVAENKARFGRKSK